MTHEMRKTVLFIIGICIFLIVVEEITYSGSSGRLLTSSRDTQSTSGDDTDLATDGLDYVMNQARGDRRKILRDEGTRKLSEDVISETKTPSESWKDAGERRESKNTEEAQKPRIEVKESADKQESEREAVRDIETEKRRQEREKELWSSRELMLTRTPMAEPPRANRKDSRLPRVIMREETKKEIELLLAKKKQDEAEKILEDEDEDDDVDTDVEEEKSTEDKSVGEGEEEEEEDDVPDEMDDIENERLEKSPYIFSEEREKMLRFVTPTMTEMKTISEWQRQTPYTHSFERCRYNMCRWEEDNRLADAVLFRAGAIRTWIIKPFPRKPGSRWIMYTNDPAIKNYGLDRADIGHNINATSTYQLHSDYPRLFGYLRRVKPPSKDYGRIFDGKAREVAWFVSHCSTWSKRELYIERMRKIIPVDVFGACGNLTCGASHYRGNDTNVCLPMLSEHYKYYLAFENSFCKDYVSEKFFKLFQGVDVIPVVQGAFDYHRYMPSNVFIDSSDFDTPEDLARYLLELSNDKYRYVKMLKRKARWTYRAAEPMHCVVCEQLHTDKKVRIHTDMVAKFNGKPPECYAPRWMQTSTVEDNSEEEEGEVASD
ncbi:hypothetical protein EGW08_001562 [Elysia chlorotica]|uniref:Fucosyltransferase n=1 Tax=Elysia chlorotica TaxID=188477 RepID=A0A433UA39_ELYCH|nr:hypothetical protein EGW08_001562 [Elysia chlorotica]